MIEYNGIKFTNCKLCNECGFLKDSQIGVLKPELGLLHIIKNQIAFMCHLHLRAFSGCDHKGTEEYLKHNDTINVCTGYIQSLKLSGTAPTNPIMAALFEEVTDIDPRIMTIEETLERHVNG